MTATNASATPVPPPRRQLLTGLAAAAVTVLVWSNWIIAVRHAATTHLPPAWLGMLRFVLPAIVLLPWWWRHGLLPRGVDRRLLAITVAGAGMPFFLLAAEGMRHATAAESGVLLGGTMPLFVAILSAAIVGERFSGSRLLGFALVVLAMAAIGGVAVLNGEGAGRFLLTGASFLWAAYTLAFRRSGLDAIAAAGITAAWSTILLLPFVAVAGIDPILAVSPSALAGQIVSQGVLSGIVALVAYGVAVKALGSSRAALSAALPPAIAALLAIPMLGEIPTPLSIAGVVLAVAGVALGSGAVRIGRR